MENRKDRGAAHHDECPCNANNSSGSFSFYLQRETHAPQSFSKRTVWTLTNLTFQRCISLSLGHLPHPQQHQHRASLSPSIPLPIIPQTPTHANLTSSFGHQTYIFCPFLPSRPFWGSIADNYGSILPLKLFLENARANFLWNSLFNQEVKVSRV